MRRFVTIVLAALLLAQAWGCRDDRNDETGRSEKQDRIDATRGTPPKQ